MALNLFRRRWWRDCSLLAGIGGWFGSTARRRVIQARSPCGAAPAGPGRRGAAGVWAADVEAEMTSGAPGPARERVRTRHAQALERCARLRDRLAAGEELAAAGATAGRPPTIS